jgi:hypothetical protein
MLESISLSHIKNYASQQSREFHAHEISVEFIDFIIERAILSGNSIVYKDPFIIVQLESGARGACFLHPGDICENDLEGIAGKPIFDLLDKVKPPIEIALLDAFFEMLNTKENIKPQSILELKGLAYQKSKERAQKLIDLAGVRKYQKLLFIGAIADLVDAAVQKGAEIKLADFGLSGTYVHGVLVEYDARPMVTWADNIIMTGNTLKTNTIVDLLETIRRNKIPLLIYALTGVNIAPRYLYYGANIVTCEKFPYYWYSNLVSSILVYKK